MLLASSTPDRTPSRASFGLSEFGYAIKCIVHGVCAGLECKRRWDHARVSDGDQSSEATRDQNSGSERDAEYVVLNLDHVDVVQDHPDEEQTSSVAKHLDSVDTVLSFIWWIIGFYWIYIGGQNLTRDFPQLFWLCITFLVFDALLLWHLLSWHVLLDLLFASLLLYGICFNHLSFNFCMKQEEEIEDCSQSLPKYNFQRTGCNTNTPTEHVLPLEDVICCICLCA
ncbi:RING-type domain-containing protein [Heracleum sosnowskyi]|uniref:RING-type E3 ubiquitin transferase n=1 Tax=Heracleum sosnowskyi TaxID=360622 RepID=A0AAD8I201_9APIA|nr:RING-type domain-containing protein [Heracleum sosnowskyi]